MLVIGLTGGIGSGKTKVADLFAEHGITIIDTDKISRDLVEPNQPAWKKIVTHFGNEFLQKNNMLNRTLLRERVFNNIAERQWLEALLHPLIRTNMKAEIEEATSSYCVVVIPLLVETKPNPLIDQILVIDADEDTQVTRAMERDNTSQEQIEKIIASQASRTQRLAIADDIIKNNGTLDDLKHEVSKLHQYYLRIATQNTI